MIRRREVKQADFQYFQQFNLGMPSVETVVPHRTIKKQFREYKLALRTRRFKEQFKFPERYAKPRPRSSYSDWYEMFTALALVHFHFVTDVFV